MAASYAIVFGENFLDEWVVHAFPSRADRDNHLSTHFDSCPVTSSEAKSIAKDSSVMVCHGDCSPLLSWNVGSSYWYRTDNFGEYGEADDETIYWQYLL